MDQERYITTDEVIRGYIREDPYWRSVSGRLDALAARFVEGVYQAGLRRVIDASSRKGMSGEYGEASILSFVALGRVMITISHPEHISVTFMGVEEGDTLGWNAVEGTLSSVERMVGDVIASWQSLTPEQQAERHRDNDDVSPWPGWNRQ